MVNFISKVEGDQQGAKLAAMERLKEAVQGQLVRS
jgi:hypothetical protein